MPDVDSNYSCTFEKGNLCSHTWLLTTEKWTIKNDFDLILDTRWEGNSSQTSYHLVSSIILDFPTILTTDKTEKEYYEVKSSFNFGFSVRSSGNVEVLLCEGWNPRSYPCYYVNMGDATNRMVSLRKIDSAEQLGKATVNLDTYKVGELKNQSR